MIITFEGRETQEELFNTIILSAQGKLGYRFINSGGAIRGAKSFTNSLALLTLCKIYPYSKWSVHRKDMTILESTTIETISKITHGMSNWQWSRKPGNYHLTYKPNGSRLLFVGANESRDKDFTDTLGLEINGAFFDQLEDVSFEYYNAVCQRLGSWHIEKEPKPLCLTTFNPHPDWVKKEKYLKWKNGQLAPNEIYFPLSPVNEPSNTKEQWDVWATMPPEVRARMIEGDWDSFENKNPYFYAWKGKDKVCKSLQRLEGYPVVISFDFNINPATCSVWQFSQGNFIHCLKAYRINNCSIQQLCDRIRTDFPGAVFRITGDPAGRSRNQGYAAPNATMYSMIADSLNLSMVQVDKPILNYASPDYHREVRVFCNTVLQNHPNIFFDAENTKDLIQDIELATTMEGSDKLFKTSGDSTYGMHLVDGLIYLFMTYFVNYVKK